MVSSEHPGRTEPGPLDRLGVWVAQQAEMAPGLRHVELLTGRSVLSLLWHGDPRAEAVLVTACGALGGLLGPADSLYFDLGVALAEQGIGTIQVGYQAPGRLPACIDDMAAAAELATSAGAGRLAVMGHSFGGAVALGLAAALPETVRAVVLLASQSGGCEAAAAGLGGRPLLLVHGDRDDILPIASSESVRTMAGHGELVVLRGAGHLLGEAGAELRELLLRWIPTALRAVPSS